MSPASRPYVEAAIRTRAFRLVYQPILDLETGAILGVEALCRFHDGRSPSFWFRECETVGLADEMDLAIIDMALDEVALLPSGHLSVNLSAATLSRPGPLCDRLRPVVDRKPIVLELTEHTVVDDYDAISDGLRMLRDAGVLLAVDDAGAGYSTLQHILRLGPDIIKLDRSLTKGIDGDPARRALTNALAIFAAQTRASVVAEGIETESQLHALRMAGVSRGQGFWFAQPRRLPLPEVEYRPTPILDVLRRTSCTVYLPWHRPQSEVGAIFDADPTLAVVPHGLLTSLVFVTSAVERLRGRDEAVPLEEFRALTSLMHAQLASITGTLKDLLRGCPPETLQALNQLGAQRARH